VRNGAQFGDWCPLELEMKFRRRTNEGEHRVATHYSSKAREMYHVRHRFYEYRFMFTDPLSVYTVNDVTLAKKNRISHFIVIIIINVG